MIVLDASAVLAVAHKEMGAAKVLARQAELWRKGHGLSLGDRACLALTRETDGVAYTTDRAWKAVGDEFGIAVRLLR